MTTFDLDLSAQEAAARLRKSAQTLKRWRRLGQGPAWTQVGGTVRYSSAALDAYLRSNTRHPRAASTILGAHA